MHTFVNLLTFALVYLVMDWLVSLIDLYVYLIFLFTCLLIDYPLTYFFGFFVFCPFLCVFITLIIISSSFFFLFFLLQSLRNWVFIVAIFYSNYFLGCWVSVSPLFRLIWLFLESHFINRTSFAKWLSKESLLHWKRGAVLEIAMFVLFYRLPTLFYSMCFYSS